MCRTVCMLVVLLAPSCSFGADVFVSPAGDDAGPGTLQRPFRTIQHGVDALEPGDTCYVRAGVYRESLTLGRSGTAEAPIRLRAYPGEDVLLDGTEPDRSSLSKELLDYAKTVDVIMGKTLYSDSWLEV